MEEYLAHIADDGRKQTVHEHIVNTAIIAENTLKCCGLGNAAFLAGILHDIGKYSSAFQKYIRCGSVADRGKVIHTFQGCRYILEKLHEDNPEASELIAFAVGAHHGLFDCVDPSHKLGMQYRLAKEDTEYEQSIVNFLTDVKSNINIEKLFSQASNEVNAIIDKIVQSYSKDDEYTFQSGMLARLLLSAVINGDRTDTASFMKNMEVNNTTDNMSSLWESRLAYAEEKISKFDNISDINKSRAFISDTCKKMSDNKSKIFRLNVPTGAGKTLSSLRFALAHAKTNNLNRIIFVSPLLSILDQNAKVIHDYVGNDELILEHHSNVVQTETIQDALDERELLLQNWDSPIIITTMVQLLNTLFDGNTSSIRRFQALCNSVILIDEVQSIPSKLLTMFNLAIQFLNEICGASVVLCSATQPYLKGTKHPLRMEPVEIVPFDEKLWKAFERTELVPLNNTRIDEMPSLIDEIMQKNDNLLVICNRKDEASKILEATEAEGRMKFHMSAAMCMQHRLDTLEDIQNALAEDQHVLCVSTQVIEAGIDISFKSVIRLTAGMDSIVQAAGRCNRNGESKINCPVYIVNCTDENLGKLQEIQGGKTASIALLQAFKDNREAFENSLSSDEAIKFYYKTLYTGMADGVQDYYVKELGTSIYDLMSLNTKYADDRCKNIESWFLWQALKTAGEYYSVFDENSTDVIVPYGEGRQIISELCSQRGTIDHDYRTKLLNKAKKYTVSVYDFQKKKLEEQNALISVGGGYALAVIDEFYDDKLGILNEPSGQLYLEV